MRLTINKLIKFLIASDLMLEIGYGFFTPIFAIFLLESIKGGTIQLAGAAVAIYWVTKSLIRVPVAYFLDKTKGEKDDFYTMLAGFSIYTLSMFLYIFAKEPIHIYGIQIFMGIGGAFAFTPWYGFFSRHLDKHHENLEWSLSVSLAGFGIAGSGYMGAFLAENFGFRIVFIIGGIISIIGTLMLYFIGQNLKIQRKDGYVVKLTKQNHERNQSF